MTSNVDLSALDRVVGKRLAGASRIVYEHAGAADVSHGDLELAFSESDVFLFGGAGDGERLALQMGAWQDPFAPPLSPENEEYARKSGKYIRLDTVAAPPTLPVGDPFVRYLPIWNQFGTLAGVRLEFSGGAVRFFVEADETYVMTPEDPRFHEWGFTEG